MGPLAQSDGHDAPRLVDELVPCRTTMVDEIVVGFEDAVGEPVVAHELPDVLDRVELWALRRQQNDGDVGRHEEARGQVPAGLVDQEDGVGSGRDGCGDLGEVQVHRLGVAGWHDQGCTLALLRADCTEDVGGSGPLVPRCAWTGAALGPAAGGLVLLADAGLVGGPDFYRGAGKRPPSRKCLPARGGGFFKTSVVPPAFSWWRGRGDSLWAAMGPTA